MFNFFKKKNSFKLSDKVWLKLDGKTTGFLDDLKAELAANQRVFIPCFFESAKMRVEEVLEKNGILYDYLDRATRSSAVVIVMAKEVEPSARLSSNMEKLTEGSDCQFLFPDHYPLYFVEANFLKFIFSMHLEARTYVFYTSLEDPLMRKFGADRIADMMKKMGHNENECITHNMITKSISNAQKKLEQKISVDEPANSPEEWFQQNVTD